ncbi:MAG: GIY-YIG nuclease family protein [Desulfobacterales bacterium]|nr:GIY-YIG nuclease family protein [Desulfobacterales bacterium]
MLKKRENLVCEYLEKISRQALEEYQELLKKYIRGRHGIYALYRKNKVDYIGLASNLRSRLRRHLSDRHGETWDRFSVYLTINDQHLKELEALLIRITEPPGNKQKGKFNIAADLQKLLKKDFDKAHNIVKDNIFSLIGETKKVFDKRTEKVEKQRKPTLAPFVKKRIHIRMRFKGKLYIAHLRRDGTIMFAAESAESDRLQGKIHYSPSLAASAISGRSMNGWTWWTYERAPGDWVKLDELRK